MSYATLSILFLLIGLIILVGEFFIPSGGFLTVIFIICLAVSVWAAWKAWGKESPVIWWTYLAAVVVIVPGVLSGVLYLLPRTEFGKRVILTAPTPDDVIPYAVKHDRLEELIGKHGRTKSLMMPGGMVLVEGKRFHAQTEGMPIEADQEIEVIDIVGNGLIVRLSIGMTPKDESVEDNPPVDDDSENRLDFEVS